MREKRETHQRRGRRVLLWSIVLYGLANVLIGAAIDGRWKELRSAYLVDIFRQLRCCAPGEPDVVCLGTSRLSMAFSAEETQRLMRQLTGDQALEVFNACCGSQDLIASDFILEQMLARGARPALAVIEITPEVLSRHDIWLGNHVLPPMPKAGNLFAFLGDLRRASFNAPGLIADRAYPLSRCRGEIWTVLGDALADRCEVDLRPPMHDRFFRRSAEGLERNVESLQARLHAAQKMFGDDDKIERRKIRVEEGLRTMRRWIKNYEVGGLTCEALDRLLSRCERHHIRVLLVAPPLASEHREIYSPEIEAVFQDCLREFQRKHRFRHVDCRDYLPDASFVDNHHVYMTLGTVPFSRRLTREHLFPEWQAAHATSCGH